MTMGTKPIRRINYEISDGDAGIYETVDYMWHYALRDAKEAEVNQLVKRLKGNNDLTTIKNIYDWVCRNVNYKLDPDKYELITSPIHYVNGNRNTGDCDCMTTLLVCLLEASGFDCSIVVIAWRKIEYTHVFSEVWHNNRWFILDPTLKQNGFGRQDKEIIRYKRTTKKGMAKLQVLSDNHRVADGVLLNGQADANKKNRKQNRNRCGCRNNDDNRNGNNININFGTSIDNAYNSSNASTDGGRPLDYRAVPRLDSIYNYKVPHKAINLSPPLILEHNSDGLYEVLDTNKNISQTGNIASEVKVGANKKVVSALNKKGVVSNNRPNYVPNVERNYYQEFP